METTAVPNSFHITEASYTVTVDVPPQPLLPTTHTKMCQYSKSVHSSEIMSMYIFRTGEHSVINLRAHKRTSRMSIPDHEKSLPSGFLG